MSANGARLDSNQPGPFDFTFEFAESAHVLAVIVRKRVGGEACWSETLKILNLTVFETTPLHQLLSVAP